MNQVLFNFWACTRNLILLLYFISLSDRSILTISSITGISESFASCHRLYDVEVIELSQHVSFLLILPPVEDVCIIPGQSDEMFEREDLTLLPVQVFEMIHMCTYQSKFISRYSRLSSILEMDIILAQQMQREVRRERKTVLLFPAWWTLIALIYKYIWAASWQNQQNDCAPSEDSHPPSLIRVFAVRMRKAWILSYPLSAQWRLWSDWADAQADLSLCWVHMPFCWFCHEAAHLHLPLIFLRWTFLDQ